LAAILTTAILLSQSPAVSQAAKQFERTEYNQAIQTVRGELSTNPEAMLVAGKAWFMLGEFKKASELFEKATVADPTNSVYFHWLGKAYGRRAETASFLTAPRYASRCRDAFEKAVQLDGSNVEAMNDLLEYYIEAPGFLGGGLDKAEALVDRIGVKDPVEKHYALARLAEKRNEFQKAEQHLRRAAELAPKQVGRVIDLAKFLAKRGKVQESEAAFQQAATIAPNDPKLLFERASTYIKSRRNLDQARTLLQQYLKADLTPDHPSREEAERLLRQVSGS
jgi:tetratricopeptide (TPR) repeat protein